MSTVASSSSVSPSPAPSSSTSQLEPLLLLARSTKPRGAAAANLVHRAISAPGVYFFGQLFDVPGVAELAASSEPELQTAYQLLFLFAYGTYKHYVSLKPSLINSDLSDHQLFKLRQLTLLSLAHQNKSLPYSTLHSSLALSSNNTRELEDLIIDTIYAGLISGKLNRLQSRFEVHYVSARDVPHASTILSQLAPTSSSALASSSSSSSLASAAGTSQLDQMLESLQNWQTTTESVLESLQARMESVKSGADDAENQRQQHHQVLLQNLVQAQNQIESQQQQQQQQQRKGKGPANIGDSNAMDIDDDNARSGSAARKKVAAVPGVRGSKRFRA
ncbi:related to cop9 signalosome complex subunit 7a [Melanopsichium pennsylvanicum]|uniref:Related to cop9 signalosome complex subunit 7a n=1 Tax=Melanopsichium pennsylvanicum TaxID=63383 RepID=A0AAJ5C6L6_9BASI|nr:related to cop9 signalosome complex subunit 7a [Melanopsichium pennsylvanicum]